jgi:hypothetical protein
MRTHTHTHTHTHTCTYNIKDICRDHRCIPTRNASCAVRVHCVSWAGGVGHGATAPSEPDRAATQRPTCRRPRQPRSDVDLFYFFCQQSAAAWIRSGREGDGSWSVISPDVATYACGTETDAIAAQKRPHDYENRPKVYHPRGCSHDG